ncbi:HAMP domain-containing histidine kinase [Olivibacter sp. LS-1]|uniref:sensor histidine kinase n=1 Tax=Olivibacter sp. LS-1 TaxID=2592345 RepID=UPI0011EAA9E6|nr:HAMP domain-containing sensor histidine kinase [Olivibacter sp. LS-1]QEL00146.1 HAMP domain-containing histidine kinase [Olivibacter sp. LS-1]
MPNHNHYRKNYWLIITFAVLASLLFIIALGFAKKYARKLVENEFVGKKIDVLDKNIESYNDLFFNKIPEVSFYQGYLDSNSAFIYADSVLKKYAFVKRILFFDAYVSHTPTGLGITPRAVYQFRRDCPKSQVIYRANSGEKFDIRIADDFNSMAARLASFIDIADTSRSVNNDEINKFFYAVIPEKITYMNIPRKEDIKAYKQFVESEIDNNSIYEQDILSYYIDPQDLKLVNNHPELYEKIEIKPLFYATLDTDPDLLTTESPLPGALASYKIYFSANRNFLIKEVNRRFMPLALMISLGYLVLFVIGYLIYRNISFNNKMFKLQYDFVNNLTHEFKTPVSVIKIAGNNIQSAKELKEDARKLYGKILDEEADKLNKLLNTLLSFTQIENKSIKLKYEKVNLKDFCEKIVNRYQLKYPGFDLQYELKDVSTLHTDQVLLGSVFQNLIDNAYKYSEEGSKSLKITIFKQKKQIMFKFVDKGIGIPRSELINIFKKFYRVKSQYNQQGSVGLGLAFCKELLNFMDGDIQVKSTLGKGSTFLVTLPYVH